MYRAAILCALVFGLTACAPPVPDSAQGVGFENYDSYLARQQAAQAQRRAVPPPQTVVVTAPPASAAPTRTPPRTEAENIAADAVAAIRPNQPAPAAASVQTAARANPNNPDISDEQDFNAVSSRRTIEDDSDRLQQKRSQYTVVQPTAVPSRPSGAAQTPIQFALSTSHPVGQRVYRRGLGGARKAAAECARYDTSEKAQDVFLRNGGPQKDKLGMDPDGDGYACSWNPAVHRR